MNQSDRELMRRSLSFLNYLDFMVTRVSEHITMPHISWMVRKVKYVYSPHEGVVVWGEWNGYLIVDQKRMELYPFIDKMAAEMPDIEDGWVWSEIFQRISNQANKHVVDVMAELQRWYVGQGLAILSGLYNFSDPLGKEEEDTSIYYCSICKAAVSGSDAIKESIGNPAIEYQFCPTCAARLDKEDKDG